MGRQNSEGNRGYKTYLVASHRSGEKRTAQRMGMLGFLLNRKSDLFVRNGVLLYKQLTRHMMDYECPV
jgi:hypothetical protein